MDAPDEQPHAPALTPIEREEAEQHRLFEAPLLTAKERKAERKRAFVELIASGCNFTEAAEALGVHRVTAFQWRREDPVFNAECMQALRVSIDLLKKEA